MKTEENRFDVIIIGSGMGGMTAASLLAKDGFSVLILEAAHVPGGCSSSYKRKGYIFESGATTLIGFDEHQPMKMLEEMLNITIPKVALNPSMTVHQHGERIIRWQDRDQWIEEVSSRFGESVQQKAFWNYAFDVSDVVWKVSGKNHFFPPIQLSDWLKLLKNDPGDLWVLPLAFKSVKQVVTGFGISNPAFKSFLDEQLMISAQSKSIDTPFLFGAPAITYTNYTNYNVPGGLLQMVKCIEESLVQNGGVLHTREKVLSIEKMGAGYELRTSKNIRYRAAIVISNIPIWNMPDITTGKVANYFSKESSRHKHAWGAFTMGLVTDDKYPDDLTLHHQLHFNEGEMIPGIASDSVFVSFSDKNDLKRAPAGERVLNISTHTEPDFWFGLNGSYEKLKLTVQNRILEHLEKTLPGFSDAKRKLVFSSTPVTWNNWVYRKKGRVGGIPQSMNRSLLDWTPSKTPFKGFYLCGDTVFPGQGIPGVTLSGINVYYRVKNNFKKLTIH